MHTSGGADLTAGAMDITERTEGGVRTLRPPRSFSQAGHSLSLQFFHGTSNTRPDISDFILLQVC